MRLLSVPPSQLSLEQLEIQNREIRFLFQVELKRKLLKITLFFLFVLFLLVKWNLTLGQSPSRSLLEPILRDFGSSTHPILNVTIKLLFTIIILFMIIFKFKKIIVNNKNMVTNSKHLNLKKVNFLVVGIGSK